MTRGVTYPTDVGNAHVIDWGLHQEVRRCLEVWGEFAQRYHEARLSPYCWSAEEDWHRYDGDLL
jgi:hypothetical protein